MDYNKILRRKLLSDILSGMSEEERREYLNEQRHNEVINALKQQNKDLHALSQHIGRQNWWTDFASDIVANFTTDDLIWLGSRLLRKV